MKGVEKVDSKNKEVLKMIISILTVIVMIFFWVDFILQNINGSQNREVLDIMLVFSGVVILLFSTEDTSNIEKDFAFQYCKYCGSKIKANVNFCSKCGKKLN